jgi:hypothetical protein
VGEWMRIRKHGWTTRHSTSVAAVRAWQSSEGKIGTVGWEPLFASLNVDKPSEFIR